MIGQTGLDPSLDRTTKYLQKLRGVQLWNYWSFWTKPCFRTDSMSEAEHPRVSGLFFGRLKTKFLSIRLRITSETVQAGCRM